jgi:chorismate mutase/prephenate dehydrogenase
MPSKADRPITIVGGGGAMGRLFGGLFSAAGYRVESLEAGESELAVERTAESSLVLLAVPIQRTCAVIAGLPPLPRDCVLADITSVKRAPLSAMLSAHSGPVVGLHPMFGPDVRSLAGQLVVVCHGRDPASYQWLLDLICGWGARLGEETAEQHDQAMQVIQAMRHFTSIAYGLFLQREQADLYQLLRLSSPIYRLELGMVGRLFAQDPALYADIMLQAEDLPKLIISYRDALDELLALLRDGQREDLIERFGEARKHFGELAPALLEESATLLRRMQSPPPDAGT